MCTCFGQMLYPTQPEALAHLPGHLALVPIADRAQCFFFAWYSARTHFLLAAQSFLHFASGLIFLRYLRLNPKQIAPALELHILPTRFVGFLDAFFFFSAALFLASCLADFLVFFSFFFVISFFLRCALWVRSLLPFSLLRSSFERLSSAFAFFLLLQYLVSAFLGLSRRLLFLQLFLLGRLLG